MTRLDYFATSLSTHIDLYQFTEEIDVQVNTSSDKLQLTAFLNGKNVSIPNLPLWMNRKLDAKFDRPEQVAFSFGYSRKIYHVKVHKHNRYKILLSNVDMCSLVSSTVNTFDDKPISLENQTQSNCSVLLVADCTRTSRFAVFATPSNQGSNSESFALEIHIDDEVIWYTPQKSGKDFIRLQNSTEIEVTALITPLGEEIDLR